MATTQTKQLNLHIAIELPDWCWSEPDADGSRYGLKTQQARMAESLRSCMRVSITEALEAEGASEYHGSGGHFDLDLSNCSLTRYQVNQVIAKAIGGFKDSQNAYSSWSFDYPAELINIKFAEYDHELCLEEIINLDIKFNKLSDAILIRE